MCLPDDATYPSFAVLAIPLIFDVVLIILTAFKVFRLVSGLRRPSGAEVVRKFPSLILCALMSAVLGSSTPYSGMEFCTYSCERTGAMPLTVNRPQATLSLLFVHHTELSPFLAHKKYNRSLSAYGIPLSGQPSQIPSLIWESTHIGLYFLCTLLLLFWFGTSELISYRQYDIETFSQPSIRRIQYTEFSTTEFDYCITFG